MKQSKRHWKEMERQKLYDSKILRHRLFHNLLYLFVEKDAAFFISDASAKTSKFESPILQNPNQSDFHLLHRNNIGRSSKLNHPVNDHRLNIRSPSRRQTIQHMCQIRYINSFSQDMRGR